MRKLRAKISLDRIPNAAFVEAVLNGLLGPMFDKARRRTVVALNLHRESHRNQTFSFTQLCQRLTAAHQDELDAASAKRIGAATAAAASGNSSRDAARIQALSDEVAKLRAQAQQPKKTAAAAAMRASTAEGATQSLGAIGSRGRPSGDGTGRIPYTFVQLAKLKDAERCFKCGGNDHMSRGCENAMVDMRAELN